MLTFEEKISKELNVSPEKAWKVIGAIEGVDKWFSSTISSCRVENGKRYCQTTYGIPLEEDIIELNHDTRTFQFGILKQSMLPASDIVETMTVRDNGKGKAIVDWSASFQATPENAPMVQEALRNLWNMGLEEMEKFINQNSSI